MEIVENRGPDKRTNKIFVAQGYILDLKIALERTIMTRLFLTFHTTRTRVRVSSMIYIVCDPGRFHYHLCLALTTINEKWPLIMFI